MSDWIGWHIEDVLRIQNYEKSEQALRFIWAELWLE